MSEFDDVLGGDDVPASNPHPLAGTRRGGRPTNEERARRTAELIASAEQQAHARRAAKGETPIKPEVFRDMLVGRNWLGKAFGMDADKTVKKRLANVEPAVRLGHNRELYLLPEIIPYLLKPKMDVASYIRTLNPGDMPNSISKVFWEAERIKGRTLLESGELWHDRDCLEVFGRTFMLIKERIPIITEGMREAGLTDEQAALLESLCDQMRADLHEALVDEPSQRTNLSRRADLEPYADPEADGDFEADEDMLG